MSSDDSDAEFFDAREEVNSPRQEKFGPSRDFESELTPIIANKEVSLLPPVPVTEEVSALPPAHDEEQQPEDKCIDDEVDSVPPQSDQTDLSNSQKPPIKERNASSPPADITNLPKRPSFESTEIPGQTPDLLACVQDRPTDLPGVRPVDVVRTSSSPVQEMPPPPAPLENAVKKKVPPARPAPPKRPPPPKRTYLTPRPGKHYLSETDGGLLTPNSTVDNLTREFTEALKQDESLKEKEVTITSEIRVSQVTEVSTKISDHTEREGVTRKPSGSSLHSRMSPTSTLKKDEEILSSVIVKNLDTGESMPLSTAAEHCLNPIALQIMSRTKEFSYAGSNASVNSFDPQTGTASVLAHSDLVDSDSLSIASDEIDIGKDATQSEHRKSKKLKDKKKRFKKFVGKGVSKVKVVAGTQMEKAVQKAKHFKDEATQPDHLNVSSDEDSTDLGSSSSIKIKASSSNKGPYHFSHLKQVQDITVHVGAVWCMKFSHCGRLLATAGQDNVIWVWVLKDFYSYFNDMRNKYDTKEDVMFGGSMRHATYSTSSDTYQPSEDEVFAYDVLSEDHRSVSEDEEDSAPFRQVPFSSYVGHSADVLDLAWSKNFFILSSSMDKTVRLWHISRKECLCCFQHIDFVTAIAFHPRDDRYFLSGSLDSKLRLWNIPDKKVALWNEVSPDGSSSSSSGVGGALITTVNFCENGKFAVCGTYDGRCIFFDTEHLKYHTQIHVRSSRGRNTKGHKITGIEPLQGEHKILVTSNDSRVRVYDLRDLSLVCKYKGHTNLSSQIKASFSPDSKYIICGSEDKCVYVWKTSLPQDVTKLSSFRRDRNDSWESMKVHDAVVTCAVFVPQPQLLHKSENSEVPETKRQTKPTSILSLSSKKQPPDEINVIVSADFKGCIKVTVCADR